MVSPPVLFWIAWANVSQPVRNPSPLVHSALALLALAAAMVLSVFKPKGVTRSGQQRPVRTGSATSAP
ncbi:hypothetical protein [Streptomyces sp. NPDC012746]|uniref:hypothetical protein n=1 Tax=Streptomyces sp. NPDC012746 TaxID=3364845 RepID=UPI0036B8AF38